MSRGAVLTMSRGPGVALGVTDVTMSQQADGLLSNVNKSGAGGDGSMALESHRRRDWDGEAVSRLSSGASFSHFHNLM